MSKLKKLLVLLMVTIIIVIHVSSYAVIALVNNNKIQISDFVTAENGNIITNASDYELYYQWLEIDKDKYNEIQKLRAELQLIQYYNIYVASFNQEDHDIYESAQQAYKAKYGNTFADLTEERVDSNESKIISLLPNYTSNWIKSTNNQYSIDLSQFEGIKNFVLWVKLAEKNGTISYNAEIFELTGTKQTVAPAPEVTPSQARQEENTQGTTNNVINILDPNNNILISDVTADGMGSVNVVALTNYSIYYQYVEIDEELYNKIKKIEDELKVIEYFNIYDTTGDTEDYDVYKSAQEFYKSKYGTYIYDGTDERIDSLESTRNSLLLTKKFNDNWNVSNNNKYTINPKTYNGIKYFILWTKLDTQGGDCIYDGEIQKLLGTKDSNPNVTPTPSQEVNPNPTPTPSQSQDILDPYNNIIIHEATNGKGTIEIIAINKPYELYYQWVEIDENLYKQIKKLEEELKIIEYFNIYDATGEQEDYDKYKSAQEAYKSKYGSYVVDGTQERIDIIESTINSLLLSKKYNSNNWTKTDDNTYKIDLSSFSGTKYFILWAKLVKPDGTEIYDGEVFEFTGTKSEDEKKDDDKKQDDNKKDDDKKQDDNKKDDDKKQDDNKKDDDKKQDDNKKDDDKKQDDNKKNDDKKQDDNKKDDNKKNNNQENTSKGTDSNKAVTTSNAIASGKLPQTGIEGKNIALISAIMGLSIVSVISFIKYKKIK